jgi:hypothetical protein
MLGLYPFSPFTRYSSPENDRMHRSAARNLAQARRDAKEFGAERNMEIKKRARAYRLELEGKKRDKCGLDGGGGEVPS